MARLPLALSLIICDSVVVDRGTGKSTLVGTFSNIVADAFPTVLHDFAVLCELTDGGGETDIEIKFVRSTPENLEAETVYSMGAKINITDPLAIGRMILRVKALEIPAPGEYRLMVESDGRLIIERRIVAMMPPRGEQPGTTS